MTAPPRPIPVRRSHGCLWGCLGVFLIVALPIVIAGVYGTWFLYDGFRRDPVMKVVGELVRRDSTVHEVLGNPVQITGVQANVFSWSADRGATSSYVITLSGPKGQGRLAVTAHARQPGTPLDKAILTGPAGSQYDLLNHRLLDAPGNSI